MAIQFRLLDENGVDAFPLPDVESFSLSPLLCDAGTLELTYPVDGLNFAQIQHQDEFFLAVYIDGVRQQRLNAVMKEVDGDDVAEGSVWKFTGFFNNGRLAEAVTYPKAWPDVDPLDVNLRFVDDSAGAIMDALLDMAQTRGTLEELTWDFTATHDSNGVAWTQTISLEYAPQVTYLEIARNLYLQGMCEFEMVGLELRLYVPGTLAEDLTTQDPPVVFRKGRDLSDSPRKRSTRGLGTVLLSAGKDGLYIERENAEAVASRRRIEAVASQGSVSDEGTLIVYSDVQLSLISQAKMEKTHGLQFTEDTPRPIRDFNVGDWAWSDTGQGLERLRIKQWVLKLEAGGNMSGTVVLNDLFAEREELLTRRIEGIIGGSTISGGSQALELLPGEFTDGVAPAAPAGLSATSEAYTDTTGALAAQATATWLAPTLNEDGSVLTDLAGYYLRYEFPEVAPGWQYINVPNGTTVSWSALPPGAVMDIEVLAYDKHGNQGAWSAQYNITTGEDDVAPPKLSDPLVDNYLGLLRVRWNGATDSGAALPFDFDFAEVHVSAVNNFTPTAATLIGVLRAPGSQFVEVPYGVDRYAKLLPVDRSGNRGVESDQAVGQAGQVVSSDIFDGAVGTAKLADLAVTTAKINALAVNDAQIGNVNVGKLVAGTMSADVIIGGRFATALTGQRVEINSLGIYRYNASGQQTVAIDNSGAFISGRYRTALTGRRIEFGESSQTASEIKFFNSAGVAKGYVDSVTFSGDYTVNYLSFGMATAANTAASKAWDAVYITDGASGGITTPPQITIASDSLNVYLHPTGGFGVFRESSRFSAGLGTVTASEDLIYITGGATPTFRMRPMDSPDLFHNIEIVAKTATPTHSPALFMGSSSGGRAGIQWRTSAGVQAIEGVDANATAYVAFRGLTYQVGSDVSTKDEIEDLDVDFLELITATAPKGYRRRSPQVFVDGQPGDRGPALGRREFGLLAHEAPPIIVSGEPGDQAIDLYQMSTIQWGAIRQLTVELRELRGMILAITGGGKK